MKILLIIVALAGLTSCKEEQNKGQQISSIKKEVTTNRHPHECATDTCRPLQQCAEMAEETYIDKDNYQFCSEIIRADISRGRVSLEDATRLKEKIERGYADFLNDVDRNAGTHKQNSCSLGVTRDLEQAAVELGGSGSLSRVLEERIISRSYFNISCTYFNGERGINIGKETFGNLVNEDLSHDTYESNVMKSDLLISAGPRSVNCNIARSIQSEYETLYERTFQDQLDFERRIRNDYAPSNLSECSYLVPRIGRVITFDELIKLFVFVDVNASELEVEEFIEDLCPEDLHKFYKSNTNDFFSILDGENNYTPIDPDTSVGQRMIESKIAECVLASPYELMGNEGAMHIKLKLMEDE